MGICCFHESHWFKKKKIQSIWSNYLFFWTFFFTKLITALFLLSEIMTFVYENIAKYQHLFIIFNSLPTLVSLFIYSPTPMTLNILEGLTIFSRWGAIKNLDRNIIENIEVESQQMVKNQNLTLFFPHNLHFNWFNYSSLLMKLEFWKSWKRQSRGYQKIWIKSL